MLACNKILIYDEYLVGDCWSLIIGPKMSNVRYGTVGGKVGDGGKVTYYVP